MSSTPTARGPVVRLTALAITVVPAGMAVAMFAAGPASAAESTVETRYTISQGSMATVGVRAQSCPADTPYLKDQNFSPGRLVPNGVEVIEMGGIGVSIGPAYGPKIPYNPPQGAGGFPGISNPTIQLATGIAGGTATNWGTEPRDFIVKLWCTSDTRQATSKVNEY